MAYQNNIPQPTDRLKDSQQDILDNFAAIFTLIGVNHANFGAAQEGKHNFVELPVQSPVPTTAAGEVGLYCKNSSITSQPELVFARQAGSTAPAAVQVTEFSSAGWSNPGWARLPSGILLKWRSGIGFGGSKTATINLNSTSPASPNFTATLTILISQIDTAASFDHVVGISNISFPNFTVYCNSTPPGTVTFAYMAIGF